jgi:hypothetical protein
MRCNAVKNLATNGLLKASPLQKINRFWVVDRNDYSIKKKNWGD